MEASLATQRDRRLADLDADAIVAYLQHVGAIAGTAPDIPELLGPATLLAGSEQLLAPQAGIVVYRATVGEHVVAEQLLIDIVEPVSGKRWPVRSRDAGIIYMGRDVRYVRQGDPLGRVSGRTSLRSGNLESRPTGQLAHLSGVIRLGGRPTDWTTELPARSSRLCLPKRAAVTTLRRD